MEKSFLMELKIFVFSIFVFSDKIIISLQCSEWLASTMEILLGYLEDQEFIKSFREWSKILIAWRDSNQAGHFLEVAVFKLRGRKGLILIPKGRGGWGWLKCSDELKKAAVFISANMGCGSESPYVSVKDERKEEEAKMGMVPCWKGPSFVEVLRSGKVPFVGGSCSRLSAALAKPCVLDLLSSVRHAEDDLRTVVDYFS
jgi:hypothetical protein